MFDYYTVSNGDAFNNPHNPGFSPSSDNPYITKLKSENGDKNPYTSGARVMSPLEYKKHGS